MSRWLHAGIRAVLFDAVGTLVFPDPPAAEVYAAAARKQGVSPDVGTIRARFLAAFAEEEEVDRRRGWVTSEDREVERWRRIVAESLPEVPDREQCFQDLYRHFARPDAWRVEPGAASVLASLSEGGLALGIASNYDARLLPVLDGHAELRPLRDRAVVSAAVGFRKPAREFFDAVARSAGCPPSAILLVGDDRVNDYDGAIAAGLEAVLLDHTGRHADVPRRIHTLRELVTS